MTLFVSFGRDHSSFNRDYSYWKTILFVLSKTTIGEKKTPKIFKHNVKSSYIFSTKLKCTTKQLNTH